MFRDDSGGGFWGLHFALTMGGFTRSAGACPAGSLSVRSNFAVMFSYPMLCDIAYLGPGFLWIETGPAFSHLGRCRANGGWDLVHATLVGSVLHHYSPPSVAVLESNEYGGMEMLSNPEECRERDVPVRKVGRARATFFAISVPSIR
jgi:hypothetical protein